jgi:TonB family protein
LEQLADTCAARGNPAGALALLQRALPTREAALGADHATVRAMRSRIAALAKAEPIVPISAPPVRPTDLVFLYQPEPAAPRPATPAPRHAAPPPPPAPPRERMATPKYSAAVAAASLIASPIQMAPAARPVPPARRTAPMSPAPSAPPASFAKIVAPGRSRDIAPDPVAHGGRRHAIAPLPTDSNRRSPGKRTTLYSFVTMAAVALAITGLTLRGNVGAAGNDVAAQPDVAPRPAAAAAAAATTSGSTMLGAATAVAAARADSVPSATTTSQPAGDVVQAGVPTPERTVAPASESAVAPAPPSLRAAARRMAAVKVPIITTNVDSLVRASTFRDQTGITGGLRTQPTGDDAGEKPPVLIAPAPLPYFPDALRSQRTEGEVVVRFRVDEHGRVDMSSIKVVKSDHELFTLAVRNVLPRFRFQPARSGAPDHKPRADWVDFRTEFTVKN